MTTLFESMIPNKTARGIYQKGLSTTKTAFTIKKIKKPKIHIKSSNDIPTIDLQNNEEPIITCFEPNTTLDKSEAKIKSKAKNDESKEDKQYRELVAQYNEAINKNKKQIPAINYTKLLNVIDTRIKEISNKDLMNEKARKQMKGHFEKTHWNVDHIIKQVEDTHLLKQDAPLILSKLQGIDELSSNQVLESLRAKYAKTQNSKYNKKQNSGNKIIVSNRTNRQFQRRVKNCLETIKLEYNVSIKMVLLNLLIET